LPFPTISVASTRRFEQENPETILNVLRATSEAVFLYKTQPELTLPVVAKYMRVPKDDPALRESYESYGKQLDQYLKTSPEGIKFILDFLAEQRLALKSKNPADFVDVRFVSKLEEEGFFKKVTTK
jgi:ABC-type nitrate/sulfonate/bicarbonate transport system substrate-binding protein